MEEVQKITVTTKKQLIAGVGCAIDFPGITKIVLQRKNGKTFYRFEPTFKSEVSMKRYNWLLRKCCNALRTVPAECFN